MENNYYYLLSKLENILNTKNIEYQTLNDIVRIYFVNGDEIKIVIGDKITMDKYSSKHDRKYVFKSEKEFLKEIENL